MSRVCAHIMLGQRARACRCSPGTRKPAGRFAPMGPTHRIGRFRPLLRVFSVRRGGPTERAGRRDGTQLRVGRAEEAMGDGRPAAGGGQT